jgi:secreted PhoX family phosphatase
MPDGWIYVSNSEVISGGGGVRALRFDAAANIVSCTVICSGTSGNCAGGKMPWGTWLTCEENGDRGRVFECDPTGVAAAVDRPALGRFNHEAAAHCVADGRVYLTEDRRDGRLYRFTPTTPGSVAMGLLEVAQVAGGGPEGTVTWLPLPDPDGSPVATRYQVAASTPFDGGEGIGSWSGKVYFATKGDNRIWSYDVATQILVILYDDSTSPTPILTGVDNIEISTDGDVLVAEDGGDMQIVAITPAGSVVPVLQVTGQISSEVTGPAFDPSRTRLYFSSQRGTTGTGSGGITYEVTGPFVV